MMQIRLTNRPFDPQREEAAFAEGHANMGALVSFVGLCRDSNDGTPVRELHIDHYAGFSETEIRRLAGDVASRFECPDILVVHRVGTILPGEAIVLVAALSHHRDTAFDAVRVLMDYLKTDAPLWKKETGADGVRWIEPRAEDKARRVEAEKEIN
jgi:molybdopterin synthase catalytic subunit